MIEGALLIITTVLVFGGIVLFATLEGKKFDEEPEQEGADEDNE